MKKVTLLVFYLLYGGFLMAQWTRLSPFTTEKFLDVDFAGPDIGVVTGENGCVYKTMDGGHTWNLIRPDKGFHFTSVAVASDNRYYVAGFRNTIDGILSTALFVSNDGGQAWQTINIYEGVSEPCQVILVGGDIYFLGAWKGLQKSRDGGDTWELVFRGGGNVLLTDLKSDRKDSSSLFVFGNVGGFATYSSLFRHSRGTSPWNGCNPFEFGDASAYTAFDFIGDTVILFRNSFKGFMPDDTSNILSLAYDFIRDDLIPGGATGDTVWHFKIKTVSMDIPHYVTDCHFFSIDGLAFTIEQAGGINRTDDGGATWSRVYDGRDALTALCMVSDTIGYAVGENGTILKMAGGASSRNPETATGRRSGFIPHPQPAN